MQQQPKYKGEIREEIIKNIKQIKNVSALRDILTISDIVARAYDEELYKMVSDEEWNRMRVVLDAIRCDATKIGRLKAFTSAFTTK